MLLGRDKDLHIYGPKGLKAILLLLKLGNAYTSYNLYFHELTSKESEVILKTIRFVLLLFLFNIVFIQTVICLKKNY